MIIFKKLEPFVNSKKVEEVKSSPSPPAVVKSSRIWGVDEEYNYEKASTAFGSYSSIPQPTKSRSYDYYVQQYGNNVWVYAAVYQIAISLASVPLNLYKKGKTKNSRPAIYDKTTDPMVKLWKRPNPFMSLFDLMEAIGAGLELTGNAYIEEVYSKNGNLIEIYPLQPHKMEIIPNSKKKVGGYIYKTATDEVKFSPDEITHLQYYNPTNDFYGLGSVAPVEVSVSTNNFAKSWNRNFFKNSALPRGALSTTGFLDEKIIKRIKSQWGAAHKGVSKAHEIAILEGGLEWKNIEISRKDLDFSILLDKDRDEILASLGVPAALLGIVENINNSSMENLKKLFWENTMLPKMEKIEADINFNLIWPNDDGLYVAFDKDAIEALKGSQEVRARLASMLVDRGLMTINEARERYFNLPGAAWGNTWYMPLNLMPVERAGEGMGTGDGGDGDKLPGRQIGRPAVGQEDVNKFIALAKLFGVKIQDFPTQTLDESMENMFKYIEDGKSGDVDG